MIKINVIDRKDSSGRWVQSFKEQDIQVFTRAGIVWQYINKRVLKSGAHQNSRPTYVGCENKFAGFQEFANWTQNQYGYMSKNNNGRFWNLDKDIIRPGNKIYSSETCLFVPDYVNNIFTDVRITNSGLPIGVHYNKGMFEASCNRKLMPSTKYLGRFDDPMEAHRAWQKAKLEYLRFLTTYPDLLNHKYLNYALLQRADMLEDCYLNQRLYNG